VTHAVDISAILLSVYLENPMSVGMFDEGTVATQSSTYPYFPASSTGSPPRVYSVGRTSSLDITNIRGFTKSATAAAAAVELSTVLLSSSTTNFFSSGVQLVLAGSFPAGRGTGAAAPGLDQWSNNYQFGERVHVKPDGQAFGASLQLWPNNKPFPLSTLGAVGSTPGERDGCQAMLMGSYAAVAGGLFTYQSRLLQAAGGSGSTGKHIAAQPALALIADEQLHPRRSNYNNQYNFWDPSGFFQIANLLSSGEKRLIDDARRILDTVAFAQHTESGQLPHHFNGATPVFTAISGATLPATNLFWLKAALRYVVETADVAWLQSRLDVITKAGTFLLDQIPEESSLLSSSGALMIDVFKRSNFTTDANSLAVDVFGLLSSMWMYLGNETASDIYSTAANGVTTALLAKLWDDDHFVQSFVFGQPFALEEVLLGSTMVLGLKPTRVIQSHPSRLSLRLPPTQ
jgi:hypothetical protein